MRFLYACIVFLMLSGCLSQPDCPGAASNKVQISFKNNLTSRAQKVLFKSIKISGIDTEFATTDSVSSISLPVNPFATEVAFTFSYGAILVNSPRVEITSVDSIRLNYSVQNIIVSTDCGPYLFCSNLGLVSSSFLNETKLVNNQLSSSETVNLTVRL